MITFCAAAAAQTIPQAIPEDSRAAAIMAYGRIGEDSYPENDITQMQFLSHIEEIEKGEYRVLPLPDIVRAIKNNTDLPPRAIGITFEGGFKSALINAIPTLIEKNIPFAVFYAPGKAEMNDPQYMNWEDLKSLSRNKNVTLGLLPAHYERIYDQPETEMRRLVNKARQMHRDNIGGEALFFSYPFGEYSADYRRVVMNSGFDAAFGLQSGAASPASDLYAIPRFTMTENYGDAQRFRTAANALPFPVTDLEPGSSIFKIDPPAIGFTVPESLKKSIQQIQCFIAGKTETNVEIIGTRVEIRATAPFNLDRVRVNCTLPAGVNAQTDEPLYRWFGMLLVNGAGEEDSENNSLEGGF